jgi:two-component system, sensor histidine kinase and response regulator
LRLGLRKKLVVGVFIYLGLLGLVGLLGLYAAQVSLSGMHAAVDHHVREVSLVGELAADVNHAQATLLLHALSRSLEEEGPYEDQVGQIQGRISTLVEELLAIQERFGDQPDIDRIYAFQTAWNDFLRVENDKFLPLSRDQRDDEAFELAQADGSLGQSFARVRAQLAVLESALPTESTERLERTEADFAFNRNILVLTLAAAGLLGIVLGLSQAARLARAIDALSQGASRVTQGNLSHRVQVHTGDELERLAESFNTMTSELQRVSDERQAMQRMKDEFISTVSHELRTPMNGVIGMNELLLRGKLGVREREYAEAAQRSGQALLAIIDDILDLSKIEAGHLELEQRRVDVRAAVEDVVVLLAAQAQKKKLELACCVDSSIPAELVGDQNRLRQILLNLVGNAIKFTDSGEVVVRAVLADRTPSGVVLRLEITDSGIGISEEAREKLFLPFSRIDASPTRRSGGTGLGLAISKRLVELMGGTIGVESQPGRGSTFSVTVPFALDAGPLAAPLQPADGALGGRRVLVVEHNPMSRNAVLDQLASMRIEAHGCADATAALHQLRAQALAARPYDLVLIDRHLGEVDGLDLARDITAEPHLSSTRVVLLNPLGETLAPDRLATVGISAVVDKPIRQARLLETLERALNGHVAGAESREPTNGPASSAGLATPSISSRMRARVLLVEDEAVSRRVATHMLRGLGFDVDVATNGREALEVLDMHVDAAPYAAVLMDCQMPELDGFETTAAIRTSEKGEPGVPIIAMTASAMRGDRERCLAVGMTDYIPKPLRFETLEGVMGRYVPDADLTASAIDWNVVASLVRDLDRSGQDDGGALGEMIAEFRLESTTRLRMLRDAVEHGDGVALQRMAHSLRGAASALGAHEVRDLASNLEQLEPDSYVGAANMIIPSLERALERATAALESGLTRFLREAQCAS